MEFQELINKYGTLSRRDSMEKIAALEDQLAEEEHIRERMAHLLAETAVALKGPEEARKRHGWQDLPEAAAALRADLAAAQAERDELRSCLLRAIEMSDEAWSDLTYRERAMLKPTIDKWRKAVGVK